MTRIDRLVIHKINIFLSSFFYYFFSDAFKLYIFIFLRNQCLIHCIPTNNVTIIELFNVKLLKLDSNNFLNHNIHLFCS